MAIINSIAAKKAEFTTYEGEKTTYNGLATTYNDAMTLETARAADFFKAMFEAPTVIPSRPCPSSIPAAYAGIDIEWTSATAITAWSDANKKIGKAVLLENSN